MQLNDIRYFIALSETLNFTRAAETCNVSQPALTRAIHKMEEELGGLLFSRERNNTHLTALGRLIEPHLHEIVSRTGHVEKLATRFIRLEHAAISVGVMCTIGPMLFASFLGRFRADHPGVELTLLEGVPDQLCAMLLEGAIDLAIMADPRGFAPELRAVPIYDERFVVACSAGHRFAREDSVPLASLDGESYLLRINCECRDVLNEICRSQNVRLIHSYRSEREDWILTMVAAGLGICFLPEYSATVPGVIGCPVVLPGVSREVCLVTVVGRRHAPPVAAFAHAVQRYSWATGQDI